MLHLLVYSSKAAYRLQMIFAQLPNFFMNQTVISCLWQQQTAHATLIWRRIVAHLKTKNIGNESCPGKPALGETPNLHNSIHMIKTWANYEYVFMWQKTKGHFSMQLDSRCPLWQTSAPLCLNVRAWPTCSRPCHSFSERGAYRSWKLNVVKRYMETQKM